MIGTAGIGPWRDDTIIYFGGGDAGPPKSDDRDDRTLVKSQLGLKIGLAAGIAIMIALVYYVRRRIMSNCLRSESQLQTIQVTAQTWSPVERIQTDVPSLIPTRHRSNEQLMNSPMSDVGSMDLHSYHDDGPLNRTQSIRQRFTDSGTGLSRPPSYVMTSEYQGSAFMRTHHESPPNRLLSGYQETAFVGYQPFEAGHDDRS